MKPPGLYTLTKPVLISAGQTLLFIAILLSSNIVVQGEMEPFIVGGDFASIYRYSHSGFINVDCVTKKHRSNWNCGGSIINQELILTAAHCLEDCTRASHIIVVVGNVHRAKGASSTAASYVIHRDYDPYEICNDIGMVKLKTRLVFGANVRRVALMKKPPYSELAYVAGWGIIDETYKISSDILKHIQQKVWNYQKCKYYMGRVKIPPGTLCASGTKKDYLAEGDSGSALVILDFIQIGLVSFKVPSVSRNLIIYTDVAQFYDWIQDNAKRIYCNKKS